MRLVIKVQQQLEREGDDNDGQHCPDDARELMRSAQLNSGCCVPRQSTNCNHHVDNDGRQQVLQRGLQLLNQQTDAIVRDVERIRQQVALTIGKT